jgi:acyl-CoA reductase-like NAD-dependent aldehyde dehydrogenase
VLEEKQISQIVDRVLKEIQGQPGAAAAMRVSESYSSPPSGSASSGTDGLFQNVDDAVAAARRAYEEFQRIPLHERARIVEEVRRGAYPHCRRLAELAVKDTKIGRVDDKTAKHQLALDKSPGVEDVQSECQSMGRGITMEQLVPFGVIGSITPTTNPAATIINHMLIMPAAGNTIVFNFHPNAAICSAEAMKLMNRLYRP